MFNGVSQIGQFNVVALDCGENSGVAQGDIMTIDKRGKIINDRYYVDKRAPHRRFRDRMEVFDGDLSHDESEKWFVVDRKGKTMLPNEPIGTLMVFRAFEKVSFALVLKATDSIHILDRTRNPETY